MDFTDIILKATEYCNSGTFKQRYKFIIVDEFQDISFDRYKLLLAIRSKSPLGKIFAVGDDWQSIYRFSGSDMGLFAEFPKYFGFTTQCKIESTYRFAQPTIKVSSEFIQKNKSQVKKNVKSPKQDSSTTIDFVAYSDDNLLADKVANTIKAIPENETVYILSRYFFDFNIFRGKYPCREDEKTVDVTIGKRKVRCLTVHQAKGLEADHIFLLKCNSDIYGFPSMISDDPILEYLLSQHEDSIEFAEERRVFYVAITRAKLSTTIYYRKDNPSVFVDEIFKTLEEDNLRKCPACGYGHLKIIKKDWAKNGSYFVTLGCTNSLGGCDYICTKFFDSEPDEDEIKKLIEKPSQPSASVRLKNVVAKTSSHKGFDNDFLDKVFPNPGSLFATIQRNMERCIMRHDTMRESDILSALRVVKYEFEFNINGSKYSEGNRKIEALITTLRRNGFEIPDIDKLSRVF